MYVYTHTYTGLSYSSFEYSELKVTGRNISVTITNTGKVPGTEIPQLYLGYPTVAVRFNQTKPIETKRNQTKRNERRNLRPTILPHRHTTQIDRPQEVRAIITHALV